MYVKINSIPEWSEYLIWKKKNKKQKETCTATALVKFVSNSWLETVVLI